jgi:hypothetical protein
MAKTLAAPNKLNTKHALLETLFSSPESLQADTGKALGTVPVSYITETN